MSPTFNEKKATQAAGRLLERAGNRMSAMKLVRMLYLADREAIVRWGRPITTDRFVFLKHGPVLSQVSSLLAEGDDPRLEPSLWGAHITRPRDGAVDLQGTLDFRQLSDGELEVLDEIAQRYEASTSWELADLTRGLPEWQDPHGGAIPFGIQDILTAQARTGKPVPAVEPGPEEAFLNFSW
jgi:uncharacterized phage-associated protein